MPRNKDIDLFKHIGLKIRNKRKELKITQEKLAEMVDVDYVQIYHYEIGRSKIPIDYLLKIAKFFDVDIYYFLGDIKKEKRDNISVINYPSNPELEKRVMMLKEIYENKSEDLIAVVNTGIENVYSALKKQNKQKRNPSPVQKKRLTGNNK
jgi:transcriptional regulator with XRE-family HTH domain